MHSIVIILYFIHIFPEQECGYSTFGALRLAGGLKPGMGRVEICLYFSTGFLWGNICDEDWDDTDAAVVCKQLGINTNSK